MPSACAAVIEDQHPLRRRRLGHVVLDDRRAGSLDARADRADIVHQRVGVCIVHARGGLVNRTLGSLASARAISRRLRSACSLSPAGLWRWAYSSRDGLQQALGQLSRGVELGASALRRLKIASKYPGLHRCGGR